MSIVKYDKHGTYQLTSVGIKSKNGLIVLNERNKIGWKRAKKKKLNGVWITSKECVECFLFDEQNTDFVPYSLSLSTLQSMILWDWMIRHQTTPVNSLSISSQLATLMTFFLSQKTILFFTTKQWEDNEYFFLLSIITYHMKNIIFHWGLCKR